jgi:hypothetical protein
MESKFEDFVGKVFWGCITGIAFYATGQLTKLSESVSQLNTNIAVIVTKMQSYEMQTKEIKERVTVIELKVNKK